MQLWESALGWKPPRFTHGPTLSGPFLNSGQPLAQQMTSSLCIVASAAMSFGTANASPSRSTISVRSRQSLILLVTRIADSPVRGGLFGS
jgi:hypothetical protein